MTSAVAPEAPPRKRYKMALTRTEFIVDDKNGLDGRYDAGSILTVDEDTAVRWLDRNIADPAPKDAPTFQDRRRAEHLKRLESVAVDEDDPEALAYNSLPPEDRQLAMRRMPRRRSRSLLEGSEVTGSEALDA